MYSVIKHLHQQQQR